MQWVGLVAVSLPGLAALAALLFTWMQMGQTNRQLRISEQGQITNRYNAAINNLGSHSIDVRLGGIYALERIMQDSSRDHPTVVSVLAAYVRQHAPLPASAAKTTRTSSTTHSPPTDIQGVMNVLAHRRPGRDRGAVVDLSFTDLNGLKAMGAQGHVYFRSADLHGARLRGADLAAADLQGAQLWDADLRSAWMNMADLRRASLNRAKLTGTWLCTFGVGCADLAGADLSDVDMTDMDLAGVNLTGATLSAANLTGANLTGARLVGAYLPRANLTRTNLTNADLTGAHLSGARLDGTKLDGTKLKGVYGLPSQKASRFHR
ncbi:pentapeptide repeat-containing protein [Streptomyces sp. NPDC001633]|uniref:pentapeptide repeat-containing protein n=1 Tax=Streptomyces sp. NPDC001633 TaxID=3364595 RepID=UPI0036A30161